MNVAPIASRGKRVRDWLDWPFFEPSHRAFAEELDRFVAAARSPPSTMATSTAPAASWSRALGEAGLLGAAVAPADEDASAIDSRSRLPRPRDARPGRMGLADFAFAMQGLGSGAIACGLAGTARASSCRRSSAASGSPPSRCPRRTRAPTSPRWPARRARTAMDIGSTAKRPGSRTAASPTSMPCSPAPGKRRAPAGSPRSSSSPTIPASRSPSASRSWRRIRWRRSLRRLPRSRQSPARRAGRGLQDRDAHARHLPRVRRGGGARLRPARARRGGGACARRGGCSARRSPTCS